jgi:hypothetical protein
MTKHHDSHPHHPHAAHPAHPAHPAPPRAVGLEDVGFWTARVLFGLLIAWGAWSALDTVTFLIGSKAATGHVVAQRSETKEYPYMGRRGAMGVQHVTTSYVDIEYADREGRHWWGTVPEGACWRADEAHLPIRYHEDDPSHVMVSTFYGLWCKAAVLLAAGAVGWAVLCRS